MSDSFLFEALTSFKDYRLHSTTETFLDVLISFVVIIIVLFVLLACFFKVGSILFGHWFVLIVEFCPCRWILLMVSFVLFASFHFVPLVMCWSFIACSATCKLTRFRMRVSQDFDSPDLMVHLIIVHGNQSRWFWCSFLLPSMG